MKKKMKRYEEGGDVEFETKQGKNENIGDDVRARAMAAMEKGSSSEPAVPKKTAAKLTPKAEAPTPKEEPKAAPKSSAFKDSPTAFKDSSSAFKGSSASAAAKEEPKERSLPRGQAKANEGVSSFIKKSMDQIGQEGRDQEARYKATQAKMKESGENLSPRMKAAMASEKSKGMKAGGSVSSASRRADGIATKGKTRGKMC
jgi:hypothetical protein